MRVYYERFCYITTYQKFIIGTDGAENDTILMVVDTKKPYIIEMELSEFDMIALRDHLTARLDEIYDNALAQII